MLLSASYTISVVHVMCSFFFLMGNKTLLLKSTSQSVTMMETPLVNQQSTKAPQDLQKTDQKIKHKTSKNRHIRLQTAPLLKYISEMERSQNILEALAQVYENNLILLQTSVSSHDLSSHIIALFVCAELPGMLLSCEHEKVSL